MIEPLISVIIPLYNQDKYVGETLSSVINQTYKNIEIVVVDDGSTDNSAKIVKGFLDPRIHYFHQANSGLPAIARNRGIKEAKGDWIAFLDHDDAWLPDKLKQQVDILCGHPEIDLICAKEIVWDGVNLGHCIPPYKYRPRSSNIFLDMIVSNRVMTCTVLVKKAVLELMGGFRENADLLAVEDYDLWLRISKKYKIYFMDRGFSKYRIHNCNATGDRTSELLRLENYVNKYVPLMISSNEEKTSFRLAQQRVYLNLAITYLLNKSSQYKKYLFKAKELAASNPIGILLSIAYLMPEQLLCILLVFMRGIRRYAKK